MEEIIKTIISPNGKVMILAWVVRNLQPGHVILALYIIVLKS